MRTATLNRQPVADTAMTCQPWCEYQNCWEDPCHNLADGVACISATTEVALEGRQPLASGPGDWAPLSLYLGPSMDTDDNGPAILLAHGDNQGIYLTPAKARELAAALTSLAALADSTPAQ